MRFYTVPHACKNSLHLPSTRMKRVLPTALLLCAACVPAQRAESIPAAAPMADAHSPASTPLSERQSLESRLDSLARAALTEIPLASASVVVVRGQDTLLARAYGQAELSFGVAATLATRYRLIGPGITLLSAAVLRAVEQGRLSLDDDAAQYLPEFPWQGRRVTIRQLLDATSGLPDFHYLGDDYPRLARTRAHGRDHGTHREPAVRARTWVGLELDDLGLPSRWRYPRTGHG